jgi:hypothetical protein
MEHSHYGVILDRQLELLNMSHDFIHTDPLVHVGVHLLKEVLDHLNWDLQRGISLSKILSWKPSLRLHPLNRLGQIRVLSLLCCHVDSRLFSLLFVCLLETETPLNDVHLLSPVPRLLFFLVGFFRHRGGEVVFLSFEFFESLEVHEGKFEAVELRV